MVFTVRMSGAEGASATIKVTNVIKLRKSFSQPVFFPHIRNKCVLACKKIMNPTQYAFPLLMLHITRLNVKSVFSSETVPKPYERLSRLSKFTARTLFLTPATFCYVETFPIYEHIDVHDYSFRDQKQKCPSTYKTTHNIIAPNPENVNYNL